LHLYDFLAPAYDPIFESVFRPFRTRALDVLHDLQGAAVIDIACGTGQNFPFLAELVGPHGKIIGVDISSGMLTRARRRAEREGLTNVTLIQMNAAQLNVAVLKAYTDLTAVDFILCTHGLTSMREWRAVFWASWNLLKPGGGYLIHDVAAEKRTWHTFAVEKATRSHFSSQVWQPLQSECIDFRMDYLDPSAHLFGGRLFVARGTKPLAASPPPSCPS